MAHDTIPSAPALPVLSPPKRNSMSPVDQTAPSLPTELRAIIDDFRRTRKQLEAEVIPEGINEKTGKPAPPYWPDPKGADVFVELETRKANRVLARGERVDVAAAQLAMGLLARSYGLEPVRRAMRFAFIAS